MTKAEIKDYIDSRPLDPTKKVIKHFDKKGIKINDSLLSRIRNLIKTVHDEYKKAELAEIYAFRDFVKFIT